MNKDQRDYRYDDEEIDPMHGVRKNKRRAKRRIIKQNLNDIRDGVLDYEDYEDYYDDSNTR